jgi:hypothetical protein
MNGFHAVIATLGFDNAYVLVDANGSYKWDLKGRYNSLDQILKQPGMAIEVSLMKMYHIF